MITEFISTIIAYINELSGGNQTLAAAIMLSFTGIAGYIMNQAPALIKNIFMRRLVATLEVSNSGWYGERVFSKVTNHLMQKCNQKKISTYAVNSDYCQKLRGIKTNIDIGYGFHFVWYNKIPIVIRRAKMDKAGMEKMFETTTVYTIKLFKGVFKDIIEESTKEPEDDRLSIMVYKENQWQILQKEEKRPLQCLALNPETVQFFKHDIEFFLSSEKDYYRLNLPYKEAIIVHGKPGSGKTSLIKALASEYDFNVLLISLDNMSDQSLKQAFATAPERSFILIEDFDSAIATKQRAAPVKGESKEPTIADAMAEMGGISLSGLLNTLDGICALNKIFVFMTTNVLDSTDEAIRRPGRIDHVVELPKIRHNVVKDYFERLYPELCEVDVDYKDMDGCDINKIVFQSKLDHFKAAELLDIKPKKKHLKVTG